MYTFVLMHARHPIIASPCSLHAQAFSVHGTALGRQSARLENQHIYCMTYYGVSSTWLSLLIDKNCWLIQIVRVLVEACVIPFTINCSMLLSFRSKETKLYLPGIKVWLKGPTDLIIKIRHYSSAIISYRKFCYWAKWWYIYMIQFLSDIRCRIILSNAPEVGTYRLVIITWCDQIF